MTDDRGAAALFERLLRIHSWDDMTAKSEARDILGEHGRFLPDAMDPVGDALDTLGLEVARLETEVERLRAVEMAAQRLMGETTSTDGWPIRPSTDHDGRNILIPLHTPLGTPVTTWADLRAALPPEPKP